jgi:hypothetical protein
MHNRVECEMENVIDFFLYREFGLSTRRPLPDTTYAHILHCPQCRSFYRLLQERYRTVPMGNITASPA